MHTIFLSSMLWNKAPISPFVFFAPDWQCLNSLQSTGSFSSWVFVFDICMKIFEIGKFLPMRFPLPTSHLQPWLLIVMQWNGLYFHFNPRCIITELRLPGMKALKHLKKNLISEFLSIFTLYLIQYLTAIGKFFKDIFTTPDPSTGSATK